MSEDKNIQYVKQRLLEYASGAKAVGPPSEASDREPFIDCGMVFVHQPTFRKWLGIKYKFYCSQPLAMEALIQLNAQKRFLNIKNHNGHMVHGIAVAADEAAEAS